MPTTFMNNFVKNLMVWRRRRKPVEVVHLRSDSDEVIDAMCERQEEDYLILASYAGYFVQQCGYRRGPLATFADALTNVTEHAETNRFWPNVFFRMLSGEERLVLQEEIDKVTDSVR